MILIFAGCFSNQKFEDFHSVKSIQLIRVFSIQLVWPTLLSKWFRRSDQLFFCDSEMFERSKKELQIKFFKYIKQYRKDRDCEKWITHIKLRLKGKKLKWTGSDKFSVKQKIENLIHTFKVYFCSEVATFGGQKCYWKDLRDHYCFFQQLVSCLALTVKSSWHLKLG